MAPDTADVAHYLVAEDGRAYKLPYDRSVFFGRAEGNLLYIPDDRVSRQHAELCWDGENFVVTDLHSTNGTRINGEIAEQAVLEDGDAIQVGPETFVFRAATSLEELKNLRRNIRQRTARLETSEVPSLRVEHGEREMHGNLSSMPAPELVQMLNATRRTGLLVVQGLSAKAFMYFYKGELTQAEYFCGSEGVTVGDDAFLKMLTLEKGAFTFEPDRQGLSDNVEKSLQFLLLEYARKQDEEARQE
jgi:hypothetical protein